jgi:hypothetical protein
MLKTSSASSKESSAPAASVESKTYGISEKENKITQNIFPIQPRLSIGSPDDPYEKEADAMADRVMRMPDTSFIQRKCSACEEEDPIHIKPEVTFIQKKTRDYEEERIQTKPVIPFVQRKGDNSQNVASDAVVNSIQSTRGGGSALSGPTKSFMESRFDNDFSNVRVHTGDYAVQLSKELNAEAFTVGSDIYFNQGRYNTDSSGGKNLLAHELTHVVQQEGASVLSRKTREKLLPQAPAQVQRFASDEHIRIGDTAVPGQTIRLGFAADDVTYGEIIALAGDYFESMRQLRSIANDQLLADEVRFALWKVNPAVRKKPSPRNDIDIEGRVMNRAYKLASRNETHFSTGSAPGRSNREQYISLHADAIAAAHAQGRSAMIRGSKWEAMEAFANHFLTDAFSAGHVRTPRGQIKSHWSSLYPNFSANLVQMISCHMASYINHRDNIGTLATVNKLTSGIIPILEAKAGSSLSAFSVGDLISMMLHDYDNLHLLQVTSNSDTLSSTTFNWTSVGDKMLYANLTDPTDSALTAAQHTTQQMVTEAVRLSFEEVKQAYTAHSDDLTTMMDPANFRALALIPSENISITQPQSQWNAPDIRSLNPTIINLIRSTFAPGGEIREELDKIDVDDITKYEVASVEFDLHTRDAFLFFKNQFLGDVWNMLIRVAEGTDLCPPDQYFQELSDLSPENWTVEG